MPKRPGGELATRPLHFIWLTDCSGSMSIEGKIQALNTAIHEAIPHMRKVSDENPNADILVRAVKFSNGAQWHVSQATPVTDFTWTDLESLILSSRAASEVDLPEPVAPVTKMMPFLSSAMVWKDLGRSSSSMVGIFVSSFLKTMEYLPDLENILTLNRALSAS